MNIILWIIFGAVVGWVASLLMGTNGRQGVIANILIGIAGALVGGFVSRWLGMSGVTGFNLGSFLIALGGAVLLIAIFKLFDNRAV